MVDVIMFKVSVKSRFSDHSNTGIDDKNILNLLVYFYHSLDDLLTIYINMCRSELKQSDEVSDLPEFIPGCKGYTPIYYET